MRKEEGLEQLSNTDLSQVVGGLGVDEADGRNNQTGVDEADGQNGDKDG